MDKEYLVNNYIKKGDQVHKFRDAQDALGTLIIKYEDTKQMLDMICNMDNFVRVIVEK